MIQKYIKHYIRIDNNDYVIKGFTDFFEEPKEKDICIGESLKVHFEINDFINPNLFDQNNKPLYKWFNNNIIELSESERNKIQYFESFKSDKIRIEEIENIIAALIGGAL